MTSDQLIEELKVSYENAQEKEVVLSIHLFAIRFAKELVGHPLDNIAEFGTGSRSYGTEIRKGMRLAPYVVLKD